MGTRVLIIEDEIKIAQLLEGFLVQKGYSIVINTDGKNVKDDISKLQPDIVLLDIMLPEKDGFEICKEIRRVSDIPVIMLTARTEELDKLLGLELGADDYIIKPFSLREVEVRIKAVLRRYHPNDVRRSTAITRGDMEIDPERHQVKISGKEIALTPTEFNILKLLAENPGRVYSRLQILECVYGEIYDGYERSIDTHVSNLRKKIERSPDEPEFIKTVHGLGYKFEG